MDKDKDKEDSEYEEGDEDCDDEEKEEERREGEEKYNEEGEEKDNRAEDVTNLEEKIAVQRVVVKEGKYSFIPTLLPNWHTIKVVLCCWFASYCVSKQHTLCILLYAMW